jgi:hypothetical protein
MNEAKLPAMRATGTGAVSIPGSPIPPPSADDMSFTPAGDYGRCGGICDGWIRRAVHAEAFAKALEAELEALRLQTQNHHVP